MFLSRKQVDVDPAMKDYGYIEYLRKSVGASNLSSTASDNSQNEAEYFNLMSNHIKHHESKRDYYTASLRQVNHLVQIDEKPNLELSEPKWELYKISISFLPNCEFKNFKLTWALTNFRS